MHKIENNKMAENLGSIFIKSFPFSLDWCVYDMAKRGQERIHTPAFFQYKQNV